MVSTSAIGVFDAFDAFGRVVLHIISGMVNHRAAELNCQQWTIDGCIGKTVEHLLLDERLTQRKLGEVLGIAGVTVSRKIRGQIGWSANDLYVVADFFQIPVADLLPIENPDWSPGDDETFRWLPAPVKPPTSRRIQR